MNIEEERRASPKGGQRAKRVVSLKDPLLGSQGNGHASLRAQSNGGRQHVEQRPEDKLKEQNQAFESKRHRNPFAQSIHKAELYKEKREQVERKRRNQRSNGDANGAVDFDGAGHGMDDESLGALMIEQGHLPRTSAEYFAGITSKIDTSEILEIVQVFAHQQNRSAGMRASASASSLAAQAKQSQSALRQGLSGDTNDYVVIVIKIKSSQLRKFYGNGRFLVQVWRNKRRLFQHVHKYEIKSIYLNKTEIAYTLNMPPKSQHGEELQSKSNSEHRQSNRGERGQIDSSAGRASQEPFDNHLNFIFVVQPFTQIFARVLYPFEEENLDDDDLGAGGAAGQTSQIESSHNQPPFTQASTPVLFINDEYLIVAENDNIKYTKTDKIFSLIGKKPGSSGDDGSFDKPFYPQSTSKVPGFDKEVKKIRYFDGSTTTLLDPTLLAGKPRMPLRAGRAPQNKEYPRSKDPLQQDQSSQGPMDPAVLERQKCLQNNQSLYGDLHTYEKYGIVEHIEFTSPLGRSEGQILAIDQTFIETSKGRRSQTNQIVVYAAESESLNLLMYRLNCDGDGFVGEEDANLTQPEASPKAFTANRVINESMDSRGASSLEDGGFAFDGQDDGHQDFKLIGKIGTNEGGDKFVQMKIIHITDHQTLCVLKTDFGHVDVIHDIMKKSQATIYRFSDKLATEQKIHGAIHAFEFGSQKLHIQVESLNADPGARRGEAKAAQALEHSKSAYQFSVNMQTSKIDSQYQLKLPSIVTSMLDEDFFQHHVQIYDDMKVLSGMLLLSHGQCVSLFNTTKGNWVHFFNRRDCGQSNKQTRLISYLSDELDQILLDETSNLAKELRKVLDRELLLETSSARSTALVKEISEHCYFNRKEHEIVSTTFQANDSDDFFEFLINQVGGTVRKVSVIFQNTLSRHLQSDLFLQFKQQGEMAEIIQEQLVEYSKKTPKIIAQQIQSEEGNINREKQYFAIDLYAQTNYSLFREFGIFERRLFLSTMDTGKSELTQELFISEDCEQMKYLLAFEEDSDRDISIVPVHNAKSNQLFVHSAAQKRLYVLKIEQSNDEEQQSQLTIGTLLKNNVICSVPNFEHRRGKLYFLEQESLYFALRGDLYEINLINGQTKTYDFEKLIVDDCYFIMPGRHLFYRSRKNQIHFVDLNWLYPADHKLSKSLTNRCLYQHAGIPNQSSLYLSLEYDPINNDVAAFVDPSTVWILPDLGLSQRMCRGSLNYDQKFIGANVDRGGFISKLLNSDESGKYGTRQIEKIQNQPLLHKYLCPSEYVAKICALDCQSNAIKVWSVGTGKLLAENAETSLDFRGYTKHGEWNGSTLVHIDKQLLAKQQQQENMMRVLDNDLGRSDDDPRNSNGRVSAAQKMRSGSGNEPHEAHEFDIWRKIRVHEDKVSVEKEFYHNFRAGSKLFVSQKNDLIAEFHADRCTILSIKNDNRTRYLTEFKMNLPVQSPVYFSKDFRRQIRFEFKGKDKSHEEHSHSSGHTKSRLVLTVYETSELSDTKAKIKQFNNYEPLKDVYLPDFDDIKKNKSGHPYIFFKSNDVICFINKNNVEQTLPVKAKADILADQGAIQETYLPAEKLCFRMFYDCLNFSESQLRGASDCMLLQHKSIQIQEFNTDLKKIDDLRSLRSIRNSQAILDADKEMLLSSQGCFNYNMITYRKNNLRYMQAFSYDSWKTIEMISADLVSIDDLQPLRLAELLRVILPSGSTLISVLVKTNLAHLEKLIKRIIYCRGLMLKQGNIYSGNDIPFELVPDICGSTALHQCVQNTYTKASEEILDIIGKNPLGNHISIIQDILPELVETCPMAVSKYFNDRMIECPWTLKHTKGDLQLADEEVDFGVYSDPLIYVDIHEHEQKLFQRESFIDQKLEANKDQKHLPMIVKVFDFPKIHHFGNLFGRRMMAALSESDDISVFDRVFVQAILEYQWPAIRQAIIRDLFLPYVVFFFAFNYYALYWFEKDNNDRTPASFVEGILVRLALVFFCFYFCMNEYTQFQNESALKYLTSIWNYVDLIPNILVLSALMMSLFTSANADLIKWERYLHAIASFFICFRLLYFLRIFRMYGHLIKTIVEVLIDMKVFMVILFMSILTFSGSFFILAQNNEGEGVFVDSYIGSLMQMFELMLGAFDTAKFEKSTGSAIVYFMFALAALFLIVVMLNLLIAIISDTFANVQSQQKRKMYQEFAQLIFESYHLLTEAKKEECDRQGNYLFISQVHQGGAASSTLDAQKDGSDLVPLREDAGSSTHIDGPGALNTLSRQGSETKGASGSELSHGQLKMVDAMIQKHVGTMYQNLSKELKEIKSAQASQQPVRFGNDAHHASNTQAF